MTTRAGSHIPTTDGRTLLVRPCRGGEGVQLGIIGKRGSMVEAASVGLESVPGLIFAIDGNSEIAWEVHRRQMRRDRRERERRHQAALARNPWLRQGKKATVRGW